MFPTDEICLCGVGEFPRLASVWADFTQCQGWETFSRHHSEHQLSSCYTARALWVLCVARYEEVVSFLETSEIRHETMWKQQIHIVKCQTGFANLEGCVCLLSDREYSSLLGPLVELTFQYLILVFQGILHVSFIPYSSESFSGAEQSKQGRNLICVSRGIICFPSIDWHRTSVSLCIPKTQTHSVSDVYHL